MSIQLAGVSATCGSVLATAFKALTCGSAMGPLRGGLENRAGRAMAGAGDGEPVPFPRAGGETTRESGSREHGASGAGRVGSVARREPRPPALSSLLGASLLFWALVVGVPATRGSVLATEFKALTCGSAMGPLRGGIENRPGYGVSVADYIHLNPVRTRKVRLTGAVVKTLGSEI